MAIKQFNSVEGFSVGNTPNGVIDSNANITAAKLTANGNVSFTGPNVSLGSNSNVKITGGSSGQYLQTDGTGNISWQTVTVSTASISNGNSNVNIPAANGNIQVSVAGTANVITFTSNNAFRGSYGLTGAISQANTAPSSPKNGDQWYNTFNGILFEYLDDGTSSQWVDISGLPLPNLAAVNASAVLNNVQSSGTYYPAFISSTANGNYQLNSNTAFSANLANGALIATTFVGALSGAATTAGTVTTAAQPNITSVGTLTTLAVSGTTGISSTDSSGTGSTTKIIRAVNGTQDIALIPRAGAGSYNNLTAADDALINFGNTSAQGNASLTIAPWASATSGIRIQSVSNTATIFLNASTTNVSSALQVTNITTGANSTAGTVTGNWTLTAGSRWQATYADLAEKYIADATYEPGTVLLFGGEQEVTLSNAFDSTKVAGVVTTNPAYSMNAMLEAEYVAEIALQGRVPCKVQGPVEKGDLMVSATNGYATANNNARAGTIIGKALENFNGDFGIIEVAVGRF
jgi:hypothetical protein